MRYAVLLILIAFAAAPAAAELHFVNQVELTFDPAVLDVVQGDTVRWVWNSGWHTLTSGGGAADPNMGDLFNELFDMNNTQFEFTFNEVGSVPYFCLPHESQGMNGVINVAQKVAVDGGSFGRVKALYADDQPMR